MSKSWGCVLCDCVISAVLRRECGGVCICVTVRQLCMYTANYLCIDSHVVRASCASQCVCERERADRTQGITVNMNRGQHSWAVFICACSPHLFTSSSCLLSLSLSLTLPPSLPCVCMVDKSNVKQKCVCTWMFGEEGSLCTFSMWVSVCVCLWRHYVRKCVLWKDIWVVKSSRGSSCGYASQSGWCSASVFVDSTLR